MTEPLALHAPPLYVVSKRIVSAPTAPGDSRGGRICIVIGRAGFYNALSTQVCKFPDRRKTMSDSGPCRPQSAYPLRHKNRIRLAPVAKKMGKA